MATRDIKVLVIEAEHGGRSQIEKQLRELGYSRTETAGPEQSLRDLEALCPDVTIVGLSVQGVDRNDLIRRLKIMDSLLPVLVFLKSPEEKKLLGNFHGVVCLNADSPRKEMLEQLEKASNGPGDNSIPLDHPILIGRSPQIQIIRERIHRVSDKDVTVLITGETGTGKEIIARAIHYFSHRSKGPLIKISCGNLPDQLLESEVFGFQKGAFTDAHKNKPGRLELADKGTLFLDEIGDLSLFLQVKFLQIFEDRSFSRLGAVDERAVDARVVAATNFDLWKKVKEGEFRQDLFHRLNVVHIRTPALRDRRDDIPLLVEHFLNKYCSLLKRERLEFTKEVLDRLYAYHWPGNVRELENLVKRAIVLRNWDFIAQEIHASDFRQGDVDHGSGSALDFVRARGSVAEYFKNGNSSLREITAAYVSGIERKVILDTLERVRWNKRKAARLLSVSYKTVCNRIRDLDIRPD